MPQPLRFQGQYFDAESGLHYNRYRYYSPETARFITPDPIGLAGGLNQTQYVPNPTGWVDPLGLTSVKRGCPPDSDIPAGVKTGEPAVPEPNIVYRALTEQDAQRLASGGSIQGKSPDGTWTAAEHVANRSFDPSLSGGAFENSPWISTTKDLNIARAYEGGHGIIAIDLNKVPSTQVEVWKHAPRVNGIDGLPYHRSIWAQEVTIFLEIPPSATMGMIK